MKITRRQLRRIIEQAVVTGDQGIDDLVEAALVLQFVDNYLFGMRGALKQADEAKYRGGAYPGSKYIEIVNFWKGPAVRGIRDLAEEVILNGKFSRRGLVGIKDIKSAGDEGYDMSRSSETTTNKIDDLIAYLFDQTPIGMSAIEAAQVYGQNIKPQADAVAGFFDDRADYFNALDDSLEFDRVQK